MTAKKRQKWSKRLQSLIRNYILPPGIIRLHHRIKPRNRATIPSEHLALISRNESIRNIHRDKQRCFVIGAGPSLKKLNLKLLASEYYIGVNAVYLSPDLPQTSRGFWCTIDNFVRPCTDTTIQWLKSLEVSTADETVYFFPVQAYAVCQKYRLFQDRQIYYLAFGDTIGLEELDVEYVAGKMDLCAPLISPHNVIETAITCAAYMGFREVYLLGCDSDWFMYEDLNVQHFYSHDPHGYIETQEDQGAIDHPFVMDTREKKLFYSFLLYRNYRLLRDALRQRGVQVFNASRGGMLDVFPLGDFESLFPREASAE